MAFNLADAVFKQPVPLTLDAIARQEPDRIFAYLPTSVSTKEGTTTVTWASIARAVNRAAAWLDANLQPAEGTPAFAFLSGNFDLRYFVFLFAGIKAGRKAFFPSPRNSEEFHLHLLKKTGTTDIVTSIPLGPWAEKSGVPVHTIPSSEELFAEGEVEQHPYNKTLEEAMTDEICIFHSSGSTGPPKPITWNNGYFDSSRELLRLDMQRDSCYSLLFNGGRDNLISFPMFHTAGTLMTFTGAFLTGTPMIYFPSTETVNSVNITTMVKTWQPGTASLPPSVIEDIANDDSVIETMAALDAVIFGGGAVADGAGEKLSKYSNIISMIGSTEASLYPVSAPLPGQRGFTWMRFPENPGFTFREQEDGLFEIVFEKTPEFDWPVFHTFPDKTEFETQDLYMPHPELPGVWRLTGRKDDVIVLSNGEKVVPPPFEQVIKMAPEISGALYFGQGKSTVGILLELNEELTKDLSKEEVLQRIRPFALKANEMAPAFARLTKDMIIYTSKDKPMRRAPKGSLIRRGTIMDYEQEIEDLYLNAAAASAQPLVKDLSETETENTLLDIFGYVANKDIGLDDDFFTAVGMDSMQVIAVTRTIKASVQAEALEYAGKMTSAVIYANPSVKQLAAAVRSLVLTGKPEAHGKDQVAAVKSMIAKYSEGIHEAAPYYSNDSGKINVVLTGSTGSLGSYILDLLINDAKIGKIYCLNRSENSIKRQKPTNEARGLTTDFSKVVFWTANLGNRNLGLEPQQYKELVASTNLIIHNAWPVNFNQKLESFEPHVRGVRNFIELASASPLRPQVEFISSIGTVAAWDAFFPGTPRAEDINDESRLCQPGYGESKFVGEHILAAAAASGVSATIARVGQVAGPVERAQGQWNKQEWLPSIILSSAHMKKLPTTLGEATMEWVPVDTMAKTVIQLGMADLAARYDSYSSEDDDNKDAGVTTVYNLVNPHARDWADLVPTIKARLGDVEEVSWADWAHQVLADSENPENDASKHPATKLSDFYQALVTSPDAPKVDYKGYATEHAREHSPAMAGLGPVNEQWMDLWLTQWGF